jgi:hypothetical protein
MSVVDELQLIVYQGERDGLFSVGRAPEWFGNLADRIDSEYVELPVDADGVPIKPGDTVYSKIWSGERKVRRIELCGQCWTVSLSDATFGHVSVFASEVTHERPDSWEIIANELEDWSIGNRVNGNSDVSIRAHGFADRIRKLAKNEGK